MRLSLLHKADDAHEDSVWTAAWAPGSDILVTGSVDESVKLWQQAGDGIEQLHHLSGVSLGAVSVAVDSTGTYGAVSALDGSINVWRMADYSPVGTGIKQNPSESWGLAFVPSQEQESVVLALAGGSSNSVKLVDALTGETRQTMQMPQRTGEEQKTERFVLSVAVSPDGTRLAAGSMDGTVAIFDLSSSKLLHTLEGHFKPVRSVTFTPDSKMLLTACDDMHSHLYDAEHGALIESFSGHESWVLSVAVHPDGTAFATGSSDGKVKLWDMTTKTCVQTVTEHSDQVWCVAFRGDGSRLASVSDDKSVCLFDFS